jgi:hypothetical protein
MARHACITKERAVIMPTAAIPTAFSDGTASMPRHDDLGI